MHTSKVDEKIPGSRYFTWREALFLPSIPAIALPDASQEANIQKTAVALDRVREHFQRPIVVHCWLRPSKYNAIVGGAKASLHIAGLAVDFHVQGINCQDAMKAIKQHKLWPGRMELDTTNWIHLDLGAGSDFYGRRQSA